jgi:hypothetical protein
VNVTITATSRDLIGVWMGDLALSEALAAERVTLIGETAIRNSFKKRFPLSSAAGISRPTTR